MHIVLGNQRRLAFLSAAFKGKVGPIRATAHWLPQPIGSIGLVRHGKTFGSGGFTTCTVGSWNCAMGAMRPAALRPQVS